MTLYCVLSSYHLLSALVHALSKQDRSVLAIDVPLVKAFPQYMALNAYFEKVVVAESGYVFSHSEKDTKRYYADMLGSWDDYSRIYVWGAHYSFGVHLSELRIPFIFAEDAAGVLSRPYMLENIELAVPVRSKVFKRVKNLGLYDGTGEAVTARICNVAAQADGFIADESIIDFDVVKTLQALPHEKRESIAKFFLGDLSLHCEPDSTVLLTQHFSQLKCFALEDQIWIYQLVVDYFFPGKRLIFKPHPFDLLFYRRLFPEASVIREKFPSECIPFVFDNPPKSVATISSTSVWSLGGVYPDAFALDTRYEQDFKMTHRYYGAVRIAQKLGLDLICVGANEVLAQRLMETLGPETPQVFREGEKVDGPAAFLVDDLTERGESGRADAMALLKKLPENSCVIFINSRDDYCWYRYEEKELWQSMIPLVLQKKPLDPPVEYLCQSMEEEVLYVYSRDKELLKMAKEERIEKDLAHTGIRLTSQHLGPEQEKIRMLEGILAATEKRLLYYIELEKERCASSEL